MHPEPHPSPALFSQLPATVLYSSYSSGFPVSLPYDLIRLYQEKDVLSKGLADCVTYLRALREKQARCVHQLNVQPPLPPKKRKRLQQTKRYLDSEIKNRQLAERACLNNLRACETNIYLVNMIAYQFSNTAFQAQASVSTPTLYTPTLCSVSGSEATDLTWEGWTDDTAISPFLTKGSKAIFVDDLASDTLVGDCRNGSPISKDIKRPHQLCLDAFGLSKSLPVPPNTAHSQHVCPSIMSPTAPVFRPRSSSFGTKDSFSRPNTTELSISSSAATSIVETVQKRRSSAAGSVPIADCSDTAARLHQHHRSSHHTLAHTTPHLRPQKDAPQPMNRQRTNSV